MGACTLRVYLFSVFFAVWLATPVLGQKQEPQTTDFLAPTRVELKAPFCPFKEVEVSTIVAALDYELAADGVNEIALYSSITERTASANQPTIAYVEINWPCEALSYELELRIEDAATQRASGRHLDLMDTPQVAIARTIALAAAELLRSRWTELMATHNPELIKMVPKNFTAQKVSTETPTTPPAAPNKAHQKNKPRAQPARKTLPSKILSAIAGHVGARWYSRQGSVLPLGMLSYQRGPLAFGVLGIWGRMDDASGERNLRGAGLNGSWMLWYLRRAPLLSIGVQADALMGWTSQGPDKGPFTLQEGLGCYATLKATGALKWPLGKDWNLLAQLSPGYAAAAWCLDSHCALPEGFVMDVAIGVAYSF